MFKLLVYLHSYGLHIYCYSADEEDEIILNVNCHYAQAKVGNCLLDIGDCVYVKVIFVAINIITFIALFAALTFGTEIILHRSIEFN